MHNWKGLISMKRFKNLWDRLLFRDKGIVPTKKLILYYFLFIIGMVVLSFWHFSWLFLLIATVLAISLSCADIFLLPKKDSLEVTREMPDELERYETEKVRVQITNRSPDNFSVVIKDDLPFVFHSALPVQALVKKEQQTVITYEIQPHKRGKYAFKKIYT